jgi:hypothetical protein
MRKFKTLIAFSLILFMVACDVEYFDNPNAPSSVPTAALFNNNMKRAVDATQDGWFSGRFTYVTMQYWQQSEYGDEDRYVYRESMRQTQNTLYEIAENFRAIIRLNVDEDTKLEASVSGDNENQIAVCRIMLAWTFNLMADTWGDIPYYSYGSDNPNFQALTLSGFSDEESKLSPVYASQEEIYADILKELQEAGAQLDAGKPGMSGDNLYNGDVEKWKKFANSLRLRIANKIRGVNSSLASQHINDALSSGVFTSNADNAMFAYEGNDKNASPMYIAWNVNNRSDFAVGHSFINLLKGENLVDHSHTNVTAGANPNPFLGIMDPRIHKYAQRNKNGDYVGMFISESSADAATFTIESLPGEMIIGSDAASFAETLMEYAEVCFIQSELNGWDQAWYENGVRASMGKWGVDAADADTYVAALPAASMENVLTQNYIALYMQGHTAWMNYRRTGYPKTVIPPYAEYSVYDPTADTWLDKIFTPLVEEVSDLPNRMRYPAQEQTLNGENRKAAVSKLANGDVIYSPLWWDVN